MFGTMAGVENPGSGRPEQNWAQCLADDLRGFQATYGSTEISPSAVRSRDGGMAEGGYEKREVVPGCRRGSGLFHGEVAQGRGTEEPAAPRS